MCATLEISKRTYYKYRNAQDKDYYDYLLIKEIFDESKKTYGYRRIAKEKDVKNLIIHSDQGFQYTSFKHKAICDANRITISMSRKGTPVDDSPMESFHSILKKRLCIIIISKV